MSTTGSDAPTPRKALRLWPGVVAVALLWLARVGIKAVVPGLQGMAWAAQGGLAGAAAVVLWWVFFSRAAWVERVGAIVLMVVAVAATWSLRHQSMGPVWVVLYVIPILCLAFVAWAVASRRLADGPRRATMVATIVLACGMWTLVRMEGITGDHDAEFAWRWTATAEEKLLAQVGPAPLAVPQRKPDSAAAPVEAPAPVSAAGANERVSTGTPPKSVRDEPPDSVRDRPAVSERTLERVEWPGFRGSQRDGIIRGVRLETDWSRAPPVELWRRPVGPGWSSFAVHGGLFYTQEQRGDDEVVAAYKMSTGEPVWSHRDAVRFFEANGGVGPRATPTLSQGRVYTFGATGILNALDADDGTVVWSRNVPSDAGKSVPYWGFSSSPLIVDDLVIVAAGGQLLGYDAATGAQRWTGPAGGGYSSPHLATIDGVAQILVISGGGTTSVTPGDGKVLWKHSWAGSPIVQPAMIAGGGVLVVANATSGTRRIAVAHGPGGWTVEERWTSLGLKPYFNDLVVHEGHAYGFDVRILACIDLADGQRKWKGGRYGTGQLLLLADQDLLLVLSEEGELALVKATPDQFTELARFKAIEGKTWNHPVLAGDVLLVRNGEEMAAFRLTLAAR
jgi:outer membrane protein assembly factor BamB